MTDDKKLERLEEQRQNIVAEIDRQERRLRRVELNILQAHSIHSDIGNGKKLILTARAVDHITGGSHFGHKGFDKPGVIVKIYDWDCDRLTCNIRPDGRWGNWTRTALDIPLTIIDEMRQEYCNSLEEQQS